MDYHSFDCDKCCMPSPSVEIPIDIQEEIKTEQEMMLTTYLLMVLSIETLQRRNNRLEAKNAKLRELVNSYADSFEKNAAMNNGCGPYYSGEDWLALANDMRIELAECYESWE